MRAGLTLEQGLAVTDLERIDNACDQFEAAWQAGERPELESFLAPYTGHIRTQLFRELLVLELDLRSELGEKPDRAVYRLRFRDHSSLVDEVFGSRSRTDRDKSGADARDGKEPPTMEGRGSSDSTLDAPPSGTLPLSKPILPRSNARSKPGYEILSELGRGGMGIVYKARQTALDRLVALKVIRSEEMASEAELVRFQNEAEAVAQLDHPHIVPIYEVGQMAGQRYFSMKLIAGASLDRKLEEFASDFLRVARLMQTVALAVHHAHQRGILHRDLKPANILVDEDGEPHVSDFGLARRIETDSGLTHSGFPLGTPSYMSPEQARGEKGAITTATDVYGLGSVLYALLTGKAPFAGSSLAETLDQVRTTAPELPRRINGRVPRDLEVICLKCLEKEPQRRYASASALADDLGRWLAGEPIEARPVGQALRTWMWCRRNPLAATLGGLCILSVAVGLAGVTWKWREAAIARDESNSINHFFNDDLLGQAQSNPRGASLTVGELLDRTSARLGGQFVGRPAVETSIRRTLASTYQALGLYDKAEAQLRVLVAIDSATRGPHDRQSLNDLNLLGSLLVDAGRSAQAEPLLRETSAECTRILGPDNPATLQATYQLGVLLGHLHRLDEAEETLRGCVNHQRKALGPQHQDTLRTINQLGLLLQDRGKLGEADALATEYEHGIRCLFGTKHPDNVTALASRGRVRLNQGKLEDAEQYYESAADESSRILGAEHPRTLAALGDLATVLQKRGRQNDALRLLRGAWERAGANRGADDIETLKAGCRYGKDLLESGAVAEAGRVLRLVASHGDALEPDHPLSREVKELESRIAKAIPILGELPAEAFADAP
jgi:serine/threonine-protein kinase